MDTPQVLLHVSLKECLQPSEIGELVEVSAQKGLDEGQVIAVAVREYLARQRQAMPESMTTNVHPYGRAGV